MANISHRAMLMTLNQRAWKGKATDRAVAAQAEVANAAEQGTITVIKDLTPKHLIQPIKTIMTLGRTEHYKMTLPGLVRGQHLLPTAMFEQYMLTQRTIRDQFFEVVEKFLEVYPGIIEKAEHRLGNAFRKSDFPTVNSIRSYFDYSYTPAPVPEASDWRIEGEGIDIDELRAEVADSVHNMYKQATENLMEQCKDWLTKIESQSKHYSSDAPGAMLRDAMLENMKEFVAIVRDMNITNDPKLAMIAEEMQQFADLSGPELRRDEARRKELTKVAGGLLKKLAEDKAKRKAA